MNLNCRGVTHLYCLDPDDRFYFFKDKKKSVWQVMHHGKMVARGITIKVTTCRNDLAEVRRFASKGVVVFLRHDPTLSDNPEQQLNFNALS